MNARLIITLTCGDVQCSVLQSCRPVLRGERECWLIEGARAFVMSSALFHGLLMYRKLTRRWCSSVAVCNEANIDDYGLCVICYCATRCMQLCRSGWEINEACKACNTNLAMFVIALSFESVLWKIPTRKIRTGKNPTTYIRPHNR